MAGDIVSNFRNQQLGGTIRVPPPPPIAPIQPKPKLPVIDVLRQLGLPASTPDNPLPQGPQEWVGGTGMEPRQVAIQGQPRPVAVQGPPAGMTPDQDALLKLAMAQSANPMPTLAGGAQTATRVNMPGASSYLAQPGAPPTHTMDIHNGANHSKVTFGGQGNDILAQQDFTPMSPEDITRRMAGQMAPSEEQRAAGMQMYEAMLRNRGDLLKTLAETQNVTGRLDIDRQVQLGKHAMDQQSHQLDHTAKQFALGPQGQIAAAVAKWRADGVPELDIQGRVREMEERGQLYSPLGNGGQKLGPAPSTQPGGTPPQPVGTPPPGGSSLPVYSGIQHVLDQYAREASPDGKTPGGIRGIGAFLQKLDAAKPGFVRQNWPQIEAYIKSQSDPTWGEKGLAEASRMPVRGSWWDAIPGVSTIGAASDLIANPDSRQHWQNWAQLPLGISGVPAALLKAATGDHYLLGKPDDEALGRSALRKLLGKE